MTSAAIHEAVLPILDEGKEVVLVTHSWGGIPGVASIEGHSIQERSARGKKGGVRSIMMIAASIILERGASLSGTNGTASVEWIDFEVPATYTRPGTLFSTKGLTDYLGQGKKSFGVCNHHAKEIFYHDLPSAEADYYFSLLRPHAVSTFFTPVKFVVADLKVPKAYVLCETDRVVPLERQENTVGQVGGFREIRFEGGHMPFLSEPDCTVGVIDGFAGGNGE